MVPGGDGGIFNETFISGFTCKVVTRLDLTARKTYSRYFAELDKESVRGSLEAWSMIIVMPNYFANALYISTTIFAPASFSSIHL